MNLSVCSCEVLYSGFAEGLTLEHLVQELSGLWVRLFPRVEMEAFE